MSLRILIRLLAYSLCIQISANVNQLVAQIAPSASDVDAYSGLHRAAYDGDVGRINKLAELGDELDKRDSHARSPLHVAAFASQDKAIKQLVAHGADINALEHQAYDVLTIAAVANDIELVELAIELGANPGTITSPYSGTALIAAAHLGHHEVVKQLVDAGAPLDHVNNLGWTALIEAVILGDGGPDHVKTVALLIAGGADKNIKDGAEVSPLEHARDRGYTEISNLLE